MREYEILYLLAPDLPQNKVEELNQKVSDLITKQGGQVLTLFNWGRRKLAYRVAKHDYGVYVYVNFLQSGSVIAELERILKYDDRVLKFMTVKLDEAVNVEERLKTKRELLLSSYDEEVAPVQAEAAAEAV